MMDVEIVKVLILFGLLAVSFLLGFIPVKFIWHFRGRTLETSRIYQRIISILSCFAAGVFMATCLMDLLPETREQLEDQIPHSSMFAHYPVAEFIMIMGLMLMLTTEHLAIMYQENHSHNHGTLKEEAIKNERNGILAGKEKFQVRYTTSEQVSSYSGKENSEKDNKCDVENSVTVSVRATESQDKSNFRSVLLLIALSLHSVFEGLAVGLQKETSEVLKVFLGLILHKGILSFSLGLTLTQSKLTFWGQVRSLLTFAIASPIGISIGLIIVEYGQGSSSSLAEGILQGLACGTFLYVTFFEILQHELNNPDIRLAKVIFVFFGFICMSSLFLLHEHSH